jgi:glycosyltransferase involved in cell wall biosynthesis
MGIGYNNPYLQFRIYESYSHWHYVMGMQGVKQGSDYNWVIPNYFDLDEWKPNDTEGDYLLLFGRAQQDKGLDIVKEIAKNVNKKVIVCGTWNIADELRKCATLSDSTSDDLTLMDPEIPNLFYKPPVSGLARSDLLRNAYAILMPTRYMEPFGCAGVEGMLCGTPFIASDFGAFSETIQPGVNGFRCKTLGDWLKAIEEVYYLDRYIIASKARKKYSLETIGKQYDTVFKQIHDLTKKGWYTL